jgi:hypothetical protein
MKMFMSDRRQREACLEITSPLPDTAMREAEGIVNEVEPIFDGAYLSVGALNDGFHSMFSLNEVSEIKYALADSLWGFVNA